MVRYYPGPHESRQDGQRNQAQPRLEAKGLLILGDSPTAGGQSRFGLSIEGSNRAGVLPDAELRRSVSPLAMREAEKPDDDRRDRVDRGSIRVFRSGLSVAERHTVQEGLKNGAVRLVFTTNALEMGSTSADWTASSWPTFPTA